MENIFKPIDSDIKYLYGFLKRNNIEEFFLTREFNIILMEINADDLWNAIYREVISRSNVTILLSNYTGYVDDAFIIFINFLYLENIDFFLNILDCIVIEFIGVKLIYNFNYDEFKRRLISCNFSEREINEMVLFESHLKEQDKNQIIEHVTSKRLSEKGKELILENKTKKVIKLVNTKKIFVVHGRNEKLRQEMFSFLRSIGMQPIEWEEAISYTKKGAPFIGEILEEAFQEAQVVLILLTPDDKVCLRQELYKKNESKEEMEFGYQARPNVLFEAGMAFGKIPNRTVLVQVGEVKKFSDIAGRHIIHFDGSREKRITLINRLKTAGCEIDIERKSAWQKKGDFNLKFRETNGDVIVDKQEQANVQILYENLWKLSLKLFNPNLETSHQFAKKLLKSEEMQDYFGIIIKELKEKNLDDQKVGFLDGKYIIMPNSKTLIFKKNRNESLTRLTRNNLVKMSDEEIKKILSEFFLDIKTYVEREYGLTLYLI